MSNDETRGESSDPSVFFVRGLAHSLLFVKTFRVQTSLNVHATGVKTAHLVVRSERVAQTHIFLVHT